MEYGFAGRLEPASGAAPPGTTRASPATVAGLMVSHHA